MPEALMITHGPGKSVKFFGLLHVPDISQVPEAENIAVRVLAQKVLGFLIEILRDAGGKYR